MPEEEINLEEEFNKESKAPEEKPEEKEITQEVKRNTANGVHVDTHIFAVRTTASREDQVVDFMAANAKKKGYAIYSVSRPHGIRGYIFVEAASRQDAEQAAFRIPYAKGVLPKEIDYKEIETMLEPAKKADINIKKNDIVEIISGPFKREKAKVIRFDLSKEEVIVNLLEAAVSIPLTLKLDAVKVIRREGGEQV